MGSRTISFALDEFYHVYNRGTDKRVIYDSAADYKRFSELLYLCNSSEALSVRDVYRQHTSAFEYERGEPLVAIGAYCLMPNHFHLLLTPLSEGGVSSFMNRLCTAYSMYFNQKYERSGSLFEGKFKAQHADSDEYLKYLYAYIHLNPCALVRKDWKETDKGDQAELYNFAATYTYSSLPDYVSGGREQEIILAPQHFPQYFETPSDHTQELFDWLHYDDELEER